MAESISEGTLKSWSKKVGDTVAADEEVATIETDKVRISQRSIPNPDFISDFYRRLFPLLLSMTSD